MRRGLQAAHFTFVLFILPFLGRHQSSINPDMGEEWQERTVFVIFFSILVSFSRDINYCVIKRKSLSQDLVYKAFISNRSRMNDSKL